MGPLKLVESRISADVTFNVQVISFLNIAAIDITAQCNTHLGRICVVSIDHAVKENEKCKSNSTIQLKE